MARVQVINETTLETCPGANDWTLWFQWCRYLYDDGGMQYGYRFIWKRPQSEGGGLQAARGQARVPSVEILKKLAKKAEDAGWGGYDADALTSEATGSVPPDRSGHLGWSDADVVHWSDNDLKHHK